MNWKLVLQLSLFGLAMGLATVFFLPSKIEPFFWLPIFLVCAYLIAKRAPRWHFVHGLCLGVLNSVWITGAHIAFLGSYLAGHPQEAEMMKSMPMSDNPQFLMALTGPVIGTVSGAIIGVLAFIAGRVLKLQRG